MLSTVADACLGEQKPTFHRIDRQVGHRVSLVAAALLTHLTPYPSRVSRHRPADDGRSATAAPSSLKRCLGLSGSRHTRPQSASPAITEQAKGSVACMLRGRSEEHTSELQSP